MQYSAKANQGFTLIEIIIVLVISVLGFSVISSNINSGNYGTKLQLVSRDIASALRYAQSQALLNQQSVAVDINLKDNSYSLSNQQKQYSFNQAISVSLVIAEEEYSAEQIASIRFFPDGSSTGGRIKLEWGNQFRQIDVNWITGQVTINENK